LQSLTDVSKDTYSTDTNDVPLLNEGLHAMAKHISNSQSLLEDEARAWDQGVLEDLKRYVFHGKILRGIRYRIVSEFLFLGNEIH